jgi:threonylcarbamoyladenosine tRNA methylthiotransferase MtaB
MFENSMSIIDHCGLTYLHVFPYSVRAGTPAARMPQVPRPRIKERAQRLRAQGEVRLAEFLTQQQGSRVEVLMEHGGSGRTRHFAEVAVAGGSDLAAGRMIDAIVTGTEGQRLVGEVAA